ncbi:hypothetical protein E4U50_006200 [Claviceps purpurea]|nr:hypothetical protein E4U28_008273 [Claviceps purpurea]KAG6202526.1 hypothetical protein E4U50_006200 [Claviceps purpurea]
MLKVSNRHAKLAAAKRPKDPKRVAHTGCCFGSLLGPLPETASIFDQKLELALHRPISRPIPGSPNLLNQIHLPSTQPLHRRHDEIPLPACKSCASSALASITSQRSQSARRSWAEKPLCFQPVVARPHRDEREKENDVPSLRVCAASASSSDRQEPSLLAD